MEEKKYEALEKEKNVLEIKDLEAVAGGEDLCRELPIWVWFLHYLSFARGKMDCRQRDEGSFIGLSRNH